MSREHEAETDMDFILREAEQAATTIRRIQRSEVTQQQCNTDGIMTTQMNATNRELNNLSYSHNAMSGDNTRVQDNHEEFWTRVSPSNLIDGDSIRQSALLTQEQSPLCITQPTGRYTEEIPNGSGMPIGPHMVLDGSVFAPHNAVVTQSGVHHRDVFAQHASLLPQFSSHQQRAAFQSQQPVPRSPIGLAPSPQQPILRSPIRFTSPVQQGHYRLTDRPGQEPQSQQTQQERQQLHHIRQHQQRQLRQLEQQRIPQAVVPGVNSSLRHVQASQSSQEGRNKLNFVLREICGLHGRDIHAVMRQYFSCGCLRNVTRVFVASHTTT